MSKKRPTKQSEDIASPRQRPSPSSSNTLSYLILIALLLTICYYIFQQDHVEHNHHDKQDEQVHFQRKYKSKAVNPHKAVDQTSNPDVNSIKYTPKRLAPVMSSDVSSTSPSYFPTTNPTNIPMKTIDNFRKNTIPIDVLRSYFTNLSYSFIDEDQRVEVQHCLDPLTRDFPEVHIYPSTSGNSQKSKRKIHIIFMASKSIEQDMNHQFPPIILSSNENRTAFAALLEVTQSYANRHGYTFQRGDPEEIVSRYGHEMHQSWIASAQHQASSTGASLSNHEFSLNNFVQTMKSLFMLHTIRDIAKRYNINQPNASPIASKEAEEEHWTVFLDADVLISRPMLTIDDIIDYANEAIGSGHCEIIAQQSLSTINTGFLLFHVSSITDWLIQQWVYITYASMLQHVDWQHDQGWFQQLYLLYIQTFLLRPSDASAHNKHYIPQQDSHRLSKIYNCGEKFNIVSHTNNNPIKNPLLRMLPVVVRGRCFVRSLLLLNMLPVTSANKPSSGLHMCMLTGLEAQSTPTFTDRISSQGFFNLHDFYGYEYLQDDKHWYQVMHPLQEISPQYIYKNTIRTKDADYLCHRVQPFAYHGKDESIRSGILRTWFNISSVDVATDLFIAGEEETTKHTLAANNTPTITTATPSPSPTFAPTSKPTLQYHAFSTGGICTKNYLRIFRMHAVDRSWQNQEWHEREDNYITTIKELKSQ